jgi:hypothetical protein
MMSQHYGSPAITVDWESLTDQQKAIIERGPRQTQLVPQMGDAASRLGHSLPDEMVAIWRGARDVSEILGADDWHRRLFASRGHWSGIGSKAPVQDVVITGPKAGIDRRAMALPYDAGVDYVISTETSYGSIPLGISAAIHQLDEFRDLPPDWNSYGAEPIPEDAIEVARDLLGAVALRYSDRPDLATPYVVGPIPYGGVQIEWRRPGREIEIEVGPRDYLAYLKIEGYGADRAFSEDEGVSLEDVMELIAWVFNAESGR